MKGLIWLFCLFTFSACASSSSSDSAPKDKNAFLVHGKVIHLRALKEDVKKGALFNAAKRLQERDYSKGIKSFANSPVAIDLGMGNVPVLDQGQYGTCVTFSSTAAMDAALGVGDFISQQCSLMLDAALGKNYWEGADYPAEVLAPLNQYGFVGKEKCPVAYGDPGASITIPEFQALAAQGHVQYVQHNIPDINLIKTLLKSKHRVAIGVMLMANNYDPISVQGFDVKVDGVQNSGGLWACTQPSSSLNYCGNSNAGHEIVVIGYDDSQQLLKIRNSWNVDVGDKGDFYMTYSFFQYQALDMTEIYL